MARPRGKALIGREMGKACQHWYNFIESKRVIKRSLRWDGGCPNSKPGCRWIVALSIEDKKNG